MIRWTRETEGQEPKSDEIDPDASMDPPDCSITVIEMLIYDFIFGTRHE